MKLLALSFSVALLWVCCSSPRVNMTRGPRSFQPYDYQNVFALWSRDFQVLPVDGIENVLTARATYLSHEFRWAYVVRVAHDLRLSPVERQELHDREFNALGKSHEFFVTVMSGVTGSDDLDPEKGTWLIRLEDDKGRKIAPTEILKVRKPSVSETKYFDYDKIQRTGYRITFPLIADDGRSILSESTQSFSLTFSSPLGQGNMRWEATSADL
ncbi:MAG: hypothetical protein GY847_26340 [Proteobacteria bacterium]|nr:hypothetical protein [Pseudomonadota bacterium]